jgi:hypothetical protein
MSLGLMLNGNCSQSGKDLISCGVGRPCGLEASTILVENVAVYRAPHLDQIVGLDLSSSRFAFRPLSNRNEGDWVYYNYGILDI